MQRNQLPPIARCRSLSEYESFSQSAVATNCRELDEKLLSAHALEESWTVPGRSLVAGQLVEFEVDQLSGGYNLDGIWHPNLRERLVCPITHLNNRQRLICNLIADRSFAGAEIWFMEQVTPVYAWANSELPGCKIIGSEYLGPDVVGGNIIDGIRHEDVENLSFVSEALDMIVSNEVLEHVPHPQKAFSECARSLRKSGRMIVTIPFSVGADTSVVRAFIDQSGQVQDLLEPVYHGNPVSEDGSLVFTDFAWDVLKTITDCGFRDCWFDFYHSPEFGHYGSGLMILEAVK